jgi:hypothetical protein
MKSVKILFSDSKHNYSTSINPKCSEEDIKKYFLNKWFNVGAYPIENMQKCVSVEIE